MNEQTDQTEQAVTPAITFSIRAQLPTGEPYETSAPPDAAGAA